MCNSATAGTILSLVVAIAAMNIISGIVMLVKNKGRDIAILRTIGASPAAILRVFFLAGAAIGIGGTIAGVILGLLFCWNVGSIQAAIEALTGASVFNSEVYLLPRVPALVDPVDVAWVVFWSLLMSCVADLERPTDGGQWGAPSDPKLKQKFLTTTWASGIVWAAIMVILATGLIPLPEIG